MPIPAMWTAIVRYLRKSATVTNVSVINGELKLTVRHKPGVDFEFDFTDPDLLELIELAKDAGDFSARASWRDDDSL